MQVTNIRKAIAAILDTVPGLATYDKVVSDFSLPCAIVFPPETITYGLTFGSEGSRLLIPVRLYVGRSQDETVQEMLDAFISDEGSRSLKLVIEAHSNLTGLAHYTIVREARNYGPYTVDNVIYVGAEILLDIAT
jgi:hypothetical protein